jgi:sterol desaturase/sphingolipid hydroxylase (fatty acid hydroxylase superfamily)
MDPTRLVMPPIVSVFLGVLVFSICRFLLGDVWAEPFFAFFVVGYLCYDYIHFAVHHFTPKTRIGRFLKHSHMMHHYVSENLRFGVSSPFWDYIFGTMEEAKDREQAV